IGAVNTVVNREGRLTGHNTDADGLVRALADVGFILREARVAIVGAGGVARAAAFAFAWAGVADLAILARRAEQAERLAADVAPELGGSVRGGRLDPADAELRRRDLIVNCTSVGMLHSSAEAHSPLAAEALGPGTLVYDLVYNP